MPHDELLEALHNYGCECNGTIVIEARHCRLLWDRNDGGSFEARRNNGAAQGNVEDVRKEHTTSL